MLGFAYDCLNVICRDAAASGGRLPKRKPTQNIPVPIDRSIALSARHSDRRRNQSQPFILVVISTTAVPEVACSISCYFLRFRIAGSTVRLQRPTASERNHQSRQVRRWKPFVIATAMAGWIIVIVLFIFLYFWETVTRQAEATQHNATHTDACRNLNAV